MSPVSSFFWKHLYKFDARRWDEKWRFGLFNPEALSCDLLSTATGLGHTTFKKFVDFRFLPIQSNFYVEHKRLFQTQHKLDFIEIHCDLSIRDRQTILSRFEFHDFVQVHQYMLLIILSDSETRQIARGWPFRDLPVGIKDRTVALANI